MAASRKSSKKPPVVTTAPTRPPRLVVEPVEPPEVDDGDDDEEEDEDEDKSNLALYNPATHVCLTHEAHIVLLQNKQENDRNVREQTKADAQRIESLTMGLLSNSTGLQRQLEDERQYGVRQREMADGYRKELAAKDLELANMVRQSEDAKLERQRLANEIQRAQLANERLQIELDGALARKKAELETMREAASPIFKALGVGVQGLVAQQLGKMLPGAGASPNAASGGGTNGASAQSADPPEVQLNLANTAEFKAAWNDVFNRLGPESLACLRAVVCSYGLAAAGAPPLPQIVVDSLINFIQRDAGQGPVLELLKAAGAAYIPKSAPAANGTGASAPN